MNDTFAIGTTPGRPKLTTSAVGLVSNRILVGLLLVAALVAFELFNFDTTRFALRDLLGEVSFAGLRWATILAIAFCAIDFAGLVRFFTPDDQAHKTPNEVWYLMGAWMLGATMNALMTWWAVTLTLLNHDLGNEVIGRQQLLQIVPIFVAALVWLTRVLFIGAFSVAGGRIFDPQNTVASDRRQGVSRSASASYADRRPQASAAPMMAKASPDGSPARRHTHAGIPQRPHQSVPASTSQQRVRQRPPGPYTGVRGPAPAPMSAQGSSRPR